MARAPDAEYALAAHLDVPGRALHRRLGRGGKEAQNKRTLALWTKKQTKVWILRENHWLPLDVRV